MRTLELEFLEPNPRVVLGRREKVKSLLKKLAFLQSVLEQSEEKLGVSQAMKHLTSRVRDIAFKAEEDIESQVIETVCAEQKPNPIAATYTIFFLHAKLYSLFRNLAKDIEEVVKCIKETNVKELDTPNPLIFNRDNITLAASSQHTLEPEDEMVGRADELTRIRETILQHSPQERQVISIVGMGGIGKTTFAKVIYNDPLVVSHFDLLGWVTMSNNYSLRKVVCDLYHSLMKMADGEIHNASDADIANKLRQLLMGRRYFIVVDDIWGAKAWDDVQGCFPDDFNGSRILLTTRLKEVVEYTGSGKYMFNLPFLNPDESWKLFYQKVSNDQSLPIELEEIGRQIIHKCNGLPLAIAVVAGLVSKTNKSAIKWGNIASAISLLVTSEFHKQCSNILTLSYNNLPYHLKACLLYFGVFPEDSEIPVKDLISFWIAEGFIKVDSQRNLEEVAKDHLQDLIDRNLVLVGKLSFNGNMKTCKVHDLVHDLCLRETKNNKLVSILHPDNTYRWLRHQFGDKILPQTSFKCRTLLSSGPHVFCYHLCLNNCFKMLRILDLRFVSFPKAPKPNIADLFLLRYLALDSIKFMEVKEHHSRPSLQTLIVDNYYSTDIGARQWLMGIWKSQKLRHIKFLHLFPDGDLIQENLHTIRWLPEFQCTAEFFLRTPNVKTLGIQRGRDSTIPISTPISWWHNLRYLTKLEKLTVKDCGKQQSVEDYGFDRRIQLDQLQLPSIDDFPQTIKEMKLVATSLPWKAITTMSMLPNLETLKISEAEDMGEEWETSEGGFLRLKFLYIGGAVLKRWNAMGDHFPVLHSLCLHNCPNLKNFPPGFTDIMTLQLIELDHCYFSLVASARRIQAEQEGMYGKNDLVIRQYNNSRFEFLTHIFFFFCLL